MSRGMQRVFIILLILVGILLFRAGRSSRNSPTGNSQSTQRAK